MKLVKTDNLVVLALTTEEAAKLIQALVGQLAGTSDASFDTIGRDSQNPKNDARFAFVISDTP